MTLQSELNTMMQGFAEELASEDMKLITDGIEAMISDNAAAKALTAGEVAPGFSLPNVDGDVINLADLLAKGPVVLSFYRGSWCPLCNLEINALNKILPEINALGAQLIAVSPEKPDSSLAYVKEAGLNFDVLTDAENKVVKEYGLAVEVYQPLQAAYLEWELDVPAYNNSDNWLIPIPATYVINSDGKVAAAFFDVDYSKRMEPADILSALSALK